jgi:peroxiredoxin Q/BCP
MKLQVGDVAPDFTLPDQSGKPVHLTDLLGHGPVVIYFYPKDSTPGCTLEARAFQASADRFTDAGAVIVGISADSVSSHRRFAAKEHLTFRLLSDKSGEVRERYGVDKTLGIFPGRVTFVIDAEGLVRRIYSSQIQPTRHTREALKAIEGLEHPRPEHAP